MFKRLMQLCVCVTILFLLSSCTEKELSKLKDNSPVTLKGRVAMVGNTPFNYMALMLPENQQVKLVFRTHEQKDLLSKRLGKKVKLKGVLKVQDMVTADGKHRGTLYKVLVESFE